MTNLEKITNKIEALGFIAGTVEDAFEGVTQAQLQKVLDVLGEEHADVLISKKRKKHVVEIATVDSEKDVYIYTKEEYIEKYGLLTWEELIED